MTTPRNVRFARLRARIAERDGLTCWLCGDPLASLNARSTTLDHLKPRSAGGMYSFENLRLAHRACNMVRGNVAAEEAQAFVRAWLAEPSGALRRFISRTTGRPRHDEATHHIQDERPLTTDERIALQKRSEP